MRYRLRKKSPRKSLRSNFTVGIAMAMLVTSLIYMLIDYYLVYDRNTRMLKEEVEVMMVKTEKTIAHPLWLYDVNFIREYTAILANDRNVLRVTVFDERNKALVHLKNDNIIITPSTLEWSLSRDVQFNGRHVGRLAMAFSNSEVTLLTRKILLSDITIVFSLIFTVLATTWFLLSRQIFAPLVALEFNLKQISAGEYAKRVSTDMQGELGAIADEFNTMVEQVQLRERKIRENELKYRNLVESSSDIIFTTDTSGDLLFMNHNFEKQLGFKIGDFFGRHFTTLFPPMYSDDSRKKFQNGLEGKNIQIYEIEFRKLDGPTVPMELNLTIQRDIDLTPVGALGIARDITKRKKSENELRNYEQMIASTTDLMWLVDRDYTILAVNDAYANAYRKARHQLIGLNAAVHTGPDVFREKLQPYVNRCFTGENVRHQSWLDLPELGPRYMEITCHPNFELDGTVSAAVISLRDQTERKMLETQLQQTQKMEAIGTLAGGIAHDFNNILGSIIGYGEMIEMFDAKDNPKLQDRLDHILKGAYRARNLVSQILTFSRHSEQQKKPLRLAPILKEALKFLRASLPATIRIKENLDCPDDVVLANPTQVHQILMNLCTNASQAMAEKGGQIKVGLEKIDLSETDAAPKIDLDPGPYVKLSVSDIGRGIDHDILDKIFEPFFTTKKPSEGTGMGLAVVHGIVNNHNGAIQVKSHPGVGTTFQIFLPRLDVQPLEPKTPETLPLPFGQGTILFVDDEAPLVQFSKEILEYLGYRVEATTDSIKALKTFKTNPNRFDLVITDQTMPKMNGFDLAREICALRPDIPIVLCTGFSSDTTQAKAAAAGIRTVVKKPLGPKQLSDMVDTILSQDTR